MTKWVQELKVGCWSNICAMGFYMEFKKQNLLLSKNLTISFYPPSESNPISFKKMFTRWSTKLQMKVNLNWCSHLKNLSSQYTNKLGRIVWIISNLKQNCWWVLEMLIDFKRNKLRFFILIRIYFSSLFHQRFIKI